MISFQEYRPKPEVRESYTDQVVAASVARASGAKPSAAVAAIEAAAGLWERAFASARSETLTAGQLALIGRSLLLRGEAVWHVSRGRRLAPASSFAIQGGLFPESWTYRLNLAGPATTRTVSATAGTVFPCAAGALAHQAVGGLLAAHGLQADGRRSCVRRTKPGGGAFRPRRFDNGRGGPGGEHTSRIPPSGPRPVTYCSASRHRPDWQVTLLGTTGTRIGLGRLRHRERPYRAIHWNARSGRRAVSLSSCYGHRPVSMRGKHGADFCFRRSRPSERSSVPS